MSACVPILTYHSVAAETTRTFASLTVDPDLFSEHVHALREQDLDVITVAEVPAALAAGRNAVAISIDDGLADVAEHACPILARAGLPATLFIPSGYLDRRAEWLTGRDARRRMLSRSVTAELAEAGFEIGSHGARHLAVDVNPWDLVLRDALHSRLELEDCVGRPVLSFAYPFGYHSRMGRQAVRWAGYQRACAVGELPARASSDRWAIPRVQVLSGTTAEDLVALVQRRPSPGLRVWAQSKQRVWHLGRRSLGWGPVEAGRLAGGYR